MRAARAWTRALLLLWPALLLPAGCSEREKLTQPARTVTVRVLAPNGGEALLAGAEFPIAWSASATGTAPSELRVEIAYRHADSTRWVPIAANEPNDGAYLWLVPAVGLPQARLRVTATLGNSSGSDESDAAFSLSATVAPTSHVSVGDAMGAPEETVTVPVTLSNEIEATELRVFLTMPDTQVAALVAVAAAGRGAAFRFTTRPAGLSMYELHFAPQGGSRFAPGDGPVAELTFRLTGQMGETATVFPDSTVLSGDSAQRLPVESAGGVLTIEGETDPAVLTSQGWESFEARDLARARRKFDAAIAADPAYGPARTGRGWVLLETATTEAEHLATIAAFDEALVRGETGADARGGRAAALLAAGGAHLAGAAVEAREAWLGAPAFLFEHRPSFDARDLHLLEAFAEAGRGRLAEALAAADAVEPASIREDDPRTWIVDGVRYPTWASTVLAHLADVSDRYAG